MRNDKIETYEKKLIKALIAMITAQGMRWTAADLEYELMKITGNNNGDHRQAIEDYITSTYGEEVGYEF